MDTVLKVKEKIPTQLQQDHFPAKYFHCWNLGQHRKLFSSKENTDFINLFFAVLLFILNAF